MFAAGAGCAPQSMQQTAPHSSVPPTSVSGLSLQSPRPVNLAPSPAALSSRPRSPKLKAGAGHGHLLPRDTAAPGAVGRLQGLGAHRVCSPVRCTAPESQLSSAETVQQVPGGLLLNAGIGSSRRCSPTGEWCMAKPAAGWAGAAGSAFSRAWSQPASALIPQAQRESLHPARVFALCPPAACDPALASPFLH